MKKLLIIGVAMCCLFSCKKQDSKPVEVPVKQKPCYDINQAKDVVWHPIYSGYDYPTLASNGNYFESGTLKGTWTFQCDCVVVRNPSIPANNFYFKIAKLSPETLEVYTARFGVTLFYK